MKIGDKVRVKSLEEVFKIEGVDCYIPNFMLDYFGKEWLEEISTTTHDTNTDRHKDLVNHIHDVYVDKNMKYGDAFAETIEKYGMIASLTRMNDKFNRIEQFIVNGFEDSEESLKDSLLDLANYCLMTVMEIDKK